MIMWRSITFSITFVCQVFALTDIIHEKRKYIHGIIFDTVLLDGDMKEVKDNQKIQWSFFDRTHKTLILFHSVGSDAGSLSSYYQHRCTYYSTNGSLELQRLEISDSGVYQLTVEGYYSDSPAKIYSYLIFLEVEEMLSTPLIIQDPAYIAKKVQLSCIVRNGRPNQLLWSKEDKPIMNSSLYNLASDNSTLTINNVANVHCGFYTCTVTNDISQRNISHFLIAHGIQFLHKRILVSSVIALVSTMMSFAAVFFIIFFCIEKYKGQKHQTQLTVAFLFIEMKCYICLLISCILCTLDADISVTFRVISGMVFCMVLGLTGYIVFLYLHPYRDDIGSFLLRKLKKCTLPYGDIAATITAAVMIYISTVGLCFIFALKYMQTWSLQKRASRLWTR
ncbi:uncharacterized protein [Chiloscyllium punctatum]|uniref:uncharacterized protein isoform X2 n=1 Tax=Chiloscyllium punctatum TaxID=137246 RepID=UPI003B642A21